MRDNIFVRVLLWRVEVLSEFFFFGIVEMFGRESLEVVVFFVDIFEFRSKVKSVGRLRVLVYIESGDIDRIMGSD